MIETIIITIIPILIIVLNHIQEGFPIMYAALPFLFFSDRFIFIILSSNINSEYNIINKSRSVVSICMSLYHFKNQEHFTEDFLKNEAIFGFIFIFSILLVIFTRGRLVKNSYENTIEIDIIFRYFLIIFLRNYFDNSMIIYTLQMLYYIQCFGFDIIDNVLFTLVFHYFGLIPCMLLKMINMIK